MKLARVVKQVVTVMKHPFYQGEKTFLVKLLKPDGTEDGGVFVAIDRVQAGVGDLTLVLQEGSSARQITGDAKAPLRSVIVGIVDHVEYRA